MTHSTFPLRPTRAFALALFAASILATPLRAEDDVGFESMREVPAPIESVLVPMGFDNNDNVQIVVAGAYPNSCYKVGRTQHQVDNQNKIIRIDVSAYHDRNGICLMYYIPFTEVISVGVLRKGQYKVLVNEEAERPLPVVAARTDDQDNYTYANIVGVTHQGGRAFELQGVLPNSCAELSEIRVLKEVGDVIAVLPIVSFKSGCEAEEGRRIPFLKRFEVPSGTQGKKLIHVRSLNGASVNQVVDF